MNTSLQDFKNRFLEQMLKLLWSGWSQLGVAGYKARTWDRVIDIEAMILATCFWGRYDQRLFDEMLSWLISNERFINVQRLQTIIKKEAFHEARLLGPICRKLSRKNHTPKWRGIEKKLENCIIKAKPEKVFMLSDNRALPITGKTDDDFADFGFLRLPFIDRALTSGFPSRETATLQLQLRAFFGVCSRAEVMLNLILNNRASINDIAGNSYFSWRSIQETLFEMSFSGMVSHPPAKRERRYNLVSEAWGELFLSKTANSPATFNWSKFFSAMEILWQKLSDIDFCRLSDQNINLEVASLVKTRLQSLLMAADESWRIPDPASGSEDYFETFTVFVMTQLNRF